MDALVKITLDPTTLRYDFLDTSFYLFWRYVDLYYALYGHFILYGYRKKKEKKTWTNIIFYILSLQVCVENENYIVKTHTWIF
jgi:hypothetical protein